MSGDRDFLDLDAIATGGEPACTFQFDGREWHTKPKDDVPWPMLKRFFIAQASGDVGQVIVHVDEFFEAVMATDEREDFMELAQDGDLMTIKRFQKLLAFVAEKVFGLPTQPSGTSSAGRQSTRSSSRENSPSPELAPQTA